MEFRVFRFVTVESGQSRNDLGEKRYVIDKESTVTPGPALLITYIEK